MKWPSQEPEPSPEHRSLHRRAFTGANEPFHRNRAKVAFAGRSLYRSTGDEPFTRASNTPEPSGAVTAGAFQSKIVAASYRTTLLFAGAFTAGAFTAGAFTAGAFTGASPHPHRSEPCFTGAEHSPKSEP